jgi:hypothetical protein
MVLTRPTGWIEIGPLTFVEGRVDEQRAIGHRAYERRAALFGHACAYATGVKEWFVPVAPPPCDLAWDARILPCATDEAPSQ